MQQVCSKYAASMHTCSTGERKRAKGREKERANEREKENEKERKEESE